MAGMLSTFLVILLLGSGGAVAGTLSVADAYRAVPHRHTEFRRHESRMPAGEAEFLAAMFEQVNRAIAIKVEAMQALHAGRPDAAAYHDAIANVIAALDRLEVPDTLTEPHRLIVHALYVQIAVFDEWHAQAGNGTRPVVSRKHPGIRVINQDLIGAWQLLVSVFPVETAHNRQAFYDHLCALDFI